MEGLLEKLQIAQARLLHDVLTGYESDRSAAQLKLQEIKETLEELELVAQAAERPTNGSSDEGANAQSSNVLTPMFYATYLLVLLLAENLNDARFLWKRIAPVVKQESETLRKAWDIGKALWQRDFSAAYVAMDQSWPQELQPIVSLLRLSTRESTAELLSSAYSTISIQDASHALGFAQQEELVQYCATMQWGVDIAQQLVRPKARTHAHFKNTGLEQLETLSQYVLHLEQSTSGLGGEYYDELLVFIVLFHNRSSIDLHVQQPNMSSSRDLERAITLVKAKQNEYYIEAVKSALQSEQQRKLRLEKVATHVESKRLEKLFTKERRRERERLQQIQEDHALLLQAKIADWKAHGVPPQVLNAAAANESGGGDGDGTSSTAGGQALETGGRGKADTELVQLAGPHKKKTSRQMSKEALNRLATPRVTVQKAADTARPSTASATALRLQGETSQDVQLLTDIYRKQDKARLYRAVSLPALNPENLHTLTETDLLHKKMHLLQQLHGVVSQQERILTQDDQCTVRSSVSSWKSSDFTTKFATT